MRRLLALLCAGGLAACSHVDTGQIDYRIADGPTAATDLALKKRSCSSQIDVDCDLLLPGRVVRRYQPSSDQKASPFKAREVYSIDIEQGMVGDRLLEGLVFGREFGLHAEFAVLANVFEFAGPNDTDAAKRRFLESGEYAADDDPSDIELKLVYFSDNTETNQPFNMSKVPLKPRTIYNGGSIGIQIVIMEVDVQAGPVTKMLSTLARFGQKSIPGASEAKDMLFDLGESLFAGGSKDDRIFDYRFVLNSAERDPQAVDGSFVPGRYVLRRAQARQVPMDWGKLRLDHNTARLFRLGSTNKLEEVRDEMHLVLNIKKFPESTNPEVYMQQDWSTFRTVLQDNADVAAAPLNTVRKNLETVLIEQRSEQWKSKLAATWSSAEAELAEYSRWELGDLDTLQLEGCNATNEGLKGRRDNAKLDAQDAVRRFVNEYRMAMAQKYKSVDGAEEKPEFDDPERTVIRARVARHFMPWQPDLESMFADVTKFEGSFFIDGAPEDLVKRVVEAAEKRGRAAQTCQDLIERGLVAPA